MEIIKSRTPAQSCSVSTDGVSQSLTVSRSHGLTTEDKAGKASTPDNADQAITYVDSPAASAASSDHPSPSLGKFGSSDIIGMGIGVCQEDVSPISCVSIALLPLYDYLYDIKEVKTPELRHSGFCLAPGLDEKDHQDVSDR